jgi:hypothetical protein
LVPVRILVAVDAQLRLQLEVVVRALALMTSRAGNRLMSAVELKTGARVLLHREQGRPEPLLVVTRLAVDATEAPPMHVSVTIRALIELQTTISTQRR